VIIGVPKELKPDEYRVAVTPAGVRELVSRGHSVIIETEAGVPSSIPDDAFTDVGADIVPKARDVFDGAELIVKVKEPQESEVGMLGPDHTLFTFLHLAAYPKLISALTDSGATAIAYETVQLPSGSLPLLAPMSEIAGRLAAQSGAHYLERPRGGRGILIGGVSGVAPARVTVLGAGMAGTNAAKIAAGMGAEVVILDLDVERLRHLDELHWGRVVTVRSSVYAVEEFVSSSDMVIGAVLIPGGRAPVIVSEDLVRSMRPGSVIVDISIDQGGCIATSHETTHADPVYLMHDVIHYAVGNIPGAVPNTATYALTNATLPYLVALTDGIGPALESYPELLPGINIASGRLTNQIVGRDLGLEASQPLPILGLA
jgi:alanine dehydrogenase